MNAVDPIDSAWHPVAWAHEVTAAAPLARTLRGRPVALLRGRDGAVAALPDRCPHRGTALSLGSVVDGALACPYHGWEFEPDGRCRRIPSLGDSTHFPDGAHLEPLACAEHDGLVWVSLSTSATPEAIPAFPTAGSVGGDRLLTGAPLVWRTSAGRHVENILDLAHFPFVHPATFGCPEAEIVDAHEVTVGDGWLDCSVGVTTRNPDADGAPLYPGLGPTIRLGYHYRVDLPYRTTLEFAFPDGMRRAFHEVVAPNEPDRCTVYWALLVDERLTSDDEDELDFARPCSPRTSRSSRASHPASPSTAAPRSTSPPIGWRLRTVGRSATGACPKGPWCEPCSPTRTEFRSTVGPTDQRGSRSSMYTRHDARCR